ncbi:hypothetical protein [Kiloniella sp. EL199]|uniref:hypothetical protein n=1 Tax=Kiloniella sp. EL199 TaxID=2107581 RepID=UPI000EA2296D|nr:hypothetical protein [Kiloniella sp. EL199]
MKSTVSLLIKALIPVCTVFCVAITQTSASYAELEKQLDSNEVITEYGKIATGLALEERCLLLSPEETREYYWQQYLLDYSLNKIFTNAPVLNMIRGTAYQTSRDERFKCDQESQGFIQRSLQKARDLTQQLTGQTFELNVSDKKFDEERIDIIAAAAGTNAVCNHLLPEYEEQLRVGYKALSDALQTRYSDTSDTSVIDASYKAAASQDKASCGEATNQQTLQGWQLTRMLMQQFRLAFAPKDP